MTDELLLVRQPQPTRRSAACNDERLRVHLLMPRCSRKGRWLRSALVRCAMRYSAPKRSACLRIFSTSAGPRIPSGNPGKFSTRVVIESCPPGSWPSMTNGFRLARAA